jgi:hypothetical protein
MTGVTDAVDRSRVDVRGNTIGIIATLIVGAVLFSAARAGAAEMLGAVAVAQGLLAFGMVFGLPVPGWFGALAIAALAAGAADVAVSVWPHGRLGTLLAVAGLAVPVMFVHQLWRGAARVRLLQSLGLIALLVLAEVALPALVQLRHEFPEIGATHVASGVVAIATAALVAGHLVDLIVAAPRLDPDVARGLLAVLASAIVGGGTGHLTLGDSLQFPDGRGLYVGAALGALLGLLAIAVAYLEAAAPDTGAGDRRIRSALVVLLSLAFMAPVAFLLCAAIHA